MSVGFIIGPQAPGVKAKNIKTFFLSFFKPSHRVRAPKVLICFKLKWHFDLPNFRKRKIVHVGERARVIAHAG
jgi:hypothetical protein